MRTDYTYELVLGEDEGYDLLEHLCGVNNHPDVARSVAYKLATTIPGVLNHVSCSIYFF